MIASLSPSLSSPVPTAAVVSGCVSSSGDMPCTSTSIKSGEEGRGGGAGFRCRCVVVELPVDGKGAGSAVVLGLVVGLVDWDGSDCGGAVGRVP